MYKYAYTDLQDVFLFYSRFLFKSTKSYATKLPFQSWRTDNTTLKLNLNAERWNKGSYLDLLITKLTDLKEQIEQDDQEDDFD